MMQVAFAVFHVEASRQISPNYAEVADDDR